MLVFEDIATAPSNVAARSRPVSPPCSLVEGSSPTVTQCRRPAGFADVRVPIPDSEFAQDPATGLEKEMLGST